jgi:hypothetical protein
MKNTAHLPLATSQGSRPKLPKPDREWRTGRPPVRSVAPAATAAISGYWQQIQDATGNTVTTKQRHGCAKFLALTGRHGPIVLERTKPVATSRPGTTTHRANATRVSARRLFGREQMAEHEPCIGKSDDWFTPPPADDGLDIPANLRRAAP